MNKVFEDLSETGSQGKGREESAASPDDRERQQLAGLLLEDFVVERKLGEGGMGTVSLVRSQSTGQQFAVKTTKLRTRMPGATF